MAGVFYEDWNSLVPRKLIRHKQSTVYHIAVFALLGDFVSDKNGEKVWPSQVGMCETLGVSERKLRDVMTDLQEWGFLKIEQMDHFAGRRNIYLLQTGTRGGFNRQEVPVQPASGAGEGIPTEGIPTKKYMSSEAEDVFAELWKNRISGHRRDTNRMKARQKFESRLKDGYTVEKLKQAYESYAASCKERGVEERYTKQMQFFFGDVGNVDGWLNVQEQKEEMPVQFFTCPDDGAVFLIDRSLRHLTECPTCGLTIEDLTHLDRDVRERLRRAK